MDPRFYRAPVPPREPVPVSAGKHRLTGEGPGRRKSETEQTLSPDRDDEPMSDALALLKARLADVRNLGMAGALLDWDQQTYMPPGGVAARAEQRATLSKLGHMLFTSDETAKLL